MESDPIVIAGLQKSSFRELMVLAKEMNIKFVLADTPTVDHFKDLDLKIPDLIKVLDNAPILPIIPIKDFHFEPKKIKFKKQKNKK